MTAKEVFDLIESCVGFYFRFDDLYQNELMHILDMNLKSGRSEDNVNFKANNREHEFLCKFNTVDKKQQKQMLFLVSKYSLDRSILYDSFRFDLLDDGVICQLEVTDWHLENSDYVTTKKVFKLKENLKLF